MIQYGLFRAFAVGGALPAAGLLLLAGCGGPDPVPVTPPRGEPAAASTAKTGGEIPREAWPESWFRPPRTASEAGLKGFKQSPVLDEPVASGQLPPVEERLPDDPIVVQPIDEIGSYGGTATLFYAGETLLNVPEGTMRPGPQLQLALPNFARGYEYSDESRTITITLRPGHKWSDGHALTADDFAFWFEHVLMDKELMPVVEPRFKGARFEKHDDDSFSYHFPQPMPLFVKHLAHNSSRLSMPAHFMKHYHPSFTPKEQLEREARERGVMDWRTYFWAANDTRGLIFFGRPVLTAYVTVSRTSTRSRLRRNPYYPKVDPQGNQLPYIDFVDVQRVDSAEIMAAKASTGQVDFAGRQFKTADIPLFKRFEEENGFQTYLWPRPYGSDVVLMLNLTHANARLRSLFQDVRFRRALSLAIDREEINQIAYYGHGVPRQLTVVPSSRYYEPAFAAAWAEHDPQRAKALLDAMGVVDGNGDGRRDHPDGGPLHITLEYTLGETPKQVTVELASAHWREVGVHVSLKQISHSLKSIRAGLLDMSLWHADRNTDILFPIEPFWYVPMQVGQAITHWSEWSRWYRSDGERGWEPPSDVMDLIRWWEVLRRTTDPEERIEAGRNILRSQAENLWAIGIIGLGPHPVIVRNELRNVPSQGYWGWDSRWSWPYYPETWYLARAESK